MLVAISPGTSSEGSAVTLVNFDDHYKSTYRMNKDYTKFYLLLYTE